jgi:hypothetical protein
MYGDTQEGLVLFELFPREALVARLPHRSVIEVYEQRDGIREVALLNNLGIELVLNRPLDWLLEPNSLQDSP